MKRRSQLPDLVATVAIGIALAAIGVLMTGAAIAPSGQPAGGSLLAAVFMIAISIGLMVLGGQRALAGLRARRWVDVAGWGLMGVIGLWMLGFAMMSIIQGRM